MAKSKVAQGTRAPKKKRAEQPVSEGAGIEPTNDGTRVTVMRGDLALALRYISGAFDDVLAAELSDDEAQHDVLVLRALRQLRNAQTSVSC